MQLLAQWLREIGVNAQLATSDWGSVVSRRAVREPPEKGGWNVFPAAILSESASNLIGFIGHSAAGDSAWFGWPANELHEQLRDKWTQDESRGPSGCRQRNPEECLGFRAACLYGPVFTALGVAIECARRAPYARIDDSILEHRENVKGQQPIEFLRRGHVR